jgi:hypothetical protein
MKTIKKIAFIIIILFSLSLFIFFFLGVKMVKSFQSVSEGDEMIYCTLKDMPKIYQRFDFYFHKDKEMLIFNFEGITDHTLQDATGKIYTWKEPDIKRNIYDFREGDPESIMWPTYFLGKKQNVFDIIRGIKDYRNFYYQLYNYLFYYNCEKLSTDLSLFEIPEDIFFFDYSSIKYDDGNYYQCEENTEIILTEGKMFSLGEEDDKNFFEISINKKANENEWGGELVKYSSIEEVIVKGKTSYFDEEEDFVFWIEGGMAFFEKEGELIYENCSLADR